jgi:heme o synthase
VIACGCVINNVIDRDIDSKMVRTKQRALVVGLIKPPVAILYGLILGVVGFGILLAYINSLTAAVGAAGLFFYLGMYGYFKRRSWLGTLVGSISGAAPPVAGYTAVTAKLDGAAVILFLILVFWQMPHFYSIAIYRLKEYRAAGLPVLPAVKGIKRTKLEIFIYVVLFILATSSLYFFNYAGAIYAVIAGLLGLAWLRKAEQGFKAEDDSRWARQMFGYSLLILLALSAAISLGAILP